MNRYYTAGGITLSVDELTEHIMKAIENGETGKELRSKVSGSLGLLSSNAYSQGIRHGARQRPKFEDIVRAHTEGFEQGWANAMDIRDNTENWDDDQRFWDE